MLYISLRNHAHPSTVNAAPKGPSLSVEFHSSFIHYFLSTYMYKAQKLLCNNKIKIINRIQSDYKIEKKHSLKEKPRLSVRNYPVHPTESPLKHAKKKKEKLLYG